MNRRHLTALAWLLALTCAAQRLYAGWTGFDTRPDEPADRHRADGNGGHAEIDFGGQWLLARLVVTGRDPYDRNRQWELARAAYPRADESPWVREQAFPFPPGAKWQTPDGPHHDADRVMYWCMGADSPRWNDAARAIAGPFAAGSPLAAVGLVDECQRAVTPELVAEVNRKAVGGPLYPPVHALLYAPIGFIESPRVAYRVVQLLAVASALVTGFGISRLTQNRVPWPVATAFVLMYPGFRAGVELGQNPAFTLMILAGGWALAARGRDTLGGVVWGFLAFKPVWAVAFLVVPLLQRRWRFVGTMAATGVALSAATLPVVGVQAWLDWLAVGREAAGLYGVNRNWVFLSRDLFGLPRRLLLDFALPEADRGHRLAAVAGWGLWFAVFVGTTVLTLLRGDRRAVGAAAGFLLLGAYLCGYRFMYYDALLSALPLAVLVADGRRVVVVTLAGLLVLENALVQWEYRLLGTPFDTGVRWPWDTLVLLGLWAWVGWRLRRSGSAGRAFTPKG